MTSVGIPTAPVMPAETDLHTRLAYLRLRLKRLSLWMRTLWDDGLGGSVIPRSEVESLLEGGARERELRFYEQDPAASVITERLLDAETARGEPADDAPSPLVAFADAFGLGGFERDALLMAAATELDPSFGRVFAYLQDDAHATRPTAGLIWSALSPTRLDTGRDMDFAAASELLTESAPLRWYRLVNADVPAGAAVVSAVFSVDQRVALALTGCESVDPRVAALARATLPIDAEATLPRAAERLAGVLATGGPAVLNLVGPGDRGQEAIAGAMADRLDVGFLAIDSAALGALGDAAEVARLLDRECALTPLLPYFAFDERDEAATSAIRAVVEGMHGPAVVSSRRPIPFARRVFTEHLERPDAATQHRLWTGALGSAGRSLNGAVDHVVGRFDFGPSAIARAALLARDAASARAATTGTEPSLDVDDLLAACRGGIGWTLDDLAQRIEPVYDWDDIVLPDRSMAQLREIANQVEHRAHVMGAWGFGAKLSRGRGLSAMFAGPSGAGKTMAAEIIARRLGLDLYRIDLAGVVNKYIGETEKRLRDLFDAAECTGAILFFDEADALFGKRTDVKDSHDRYANIEVNYLLQRLEEYTGLAVLATNRRASVDQAFLRRLRFIVDFPSPSFLDRRRIWEGAIPSDAPKDALDLAALARLEVTGGNIRNIALNGAFLAAGAGEPISMKHLMAAARSEYEKIERLVNESEFGGHLEGVGDGR